MSRLRTQFADSVSRHRPRDLISLVCPCFSPPTAAAEARLVDSLSTALLTAAAVSVRLAVRHAVRGCVSHPAHTPLSFRALAQLPSLCRARAAARPLGSAAAAEDGPGSVAASAMASGSGVAVSGTQSEDAGSLFPSVLVAELCDVLVRDGRSGLLDNPAAGAAFVRLSALLVTGGLRGSVPGTQGKAAQSGHLLDPADLIAWVALPALRPDYPGAAVSVAIRLLLVAVSEYAAEGAGRGLQIAAPRRASDVFRCAPTAALRAVLDFVVLDFLCHSNWCRGADVISPLPPIREWVLRAEPPSTLQRPDPRSPAVAALPPSSSRSQPSPSRVQAPLRSAPCCAMGRGTTAPLRLRLQRTRCWCPRTTPWGLRRGRRQLKPFRRLRKRSQAASRLCSRLSGWRWPRRCRRSTSPPQPS